MEETNKVSETNEEVKTKTKNKPVKKAVKEEKGVKDPAKKPAAKTGGTGPAKASIVVRVKKFLRGAYGELKKVHWLGKREIVTFTGVVLVAVVLVGAGIFLVDSLLSKALSLVID